jgi:hypothetical protein
MDTPADEEPSAALRFLCVREALEIFPDGFGAERH